ncbi:MAG: PcfJ domain-containing protein, partial [Acetivibrio sp.]
TPYKMIKYMQDQTKKETNEFDIRDYHDYLQMAAGLGYDLKDPYVLYPKKERERHDQLVQEQRERKLELQLKKDSEKDEIIAKMCKQYEKKYHLESKELMIRPAKTAKEIRIEGHTLHHCVASYIDTVAMGQTCILMIRKKREPEIPFYTMEVKNEKVIQVKGKSNKGPDADVEKIVEQFKKEKLGRKVS